MLISREILTKICEELHNQNKQIVFTNGCFDILHAGHVKYLSEAKKQGDILIVGLNSDASVRRLKGEERPVNYESDRAEVLSSLRSIDYVTIFDEDTPFDLIDALKPDVLVKGGDYTIDTIVGSDIVINSGGKVIVIPLVEGKSTTSILNKMKNS